jgi:hypothetical protein
VSRCARSRSHGKGAPGAREVAWRARRAAARGRGTPVAFSRLRAKADVAEQVEIACDARFMNDARDFTLRLQDLLRCERLSLADFLVALADFDRRRLWVDLGHSSLFYFLHRELGLSKGAAFYRKTAAELVQRFPEIVEPLRDGRLCLTTVVELSKVLTSENREAVLPRFFTLSKSEAKEVTAEIRPRETVPQRAVVTAVRAPAAAPSLALAAASLDPAHVAVHPANRATDRDPADPRPVDSSGSRAASAPAPNRVTPVPERGVAQAPRPAIEPLTADLNRVHLTVSRAFLAKLATARDALSHSHPGASAEEILEAGLDLLLDRHAKRKGITSKPRREPPPSRRGHVPAHVRRAVWERDRGRCQWPIASGGICGSTLRVEIDHRTAKARGGPPTVENLRCLCRWHNDLAAREVFGDARMDRYTRGPRTTAPAEPPGPRGI